MEPGGFGEVQGGNLEAVQASVGPASKILDLARKSGLTVIHTREGHVQDLRDCPSCKVCLLAIIFWKLKLIIRFKLTRQANAPDSRHTVVIGGVGPKGSRLLVRGE